MIALALIFTSFFLNAAESPLGTLPMHPHFFELRINGHTSWLLGTIHIPEVRLDQYDDSLRRAMFAADVAFGERPSGANDAQGLVEYIGSELLQIPANRRLSPGAWRRLNLWMKDRVVEEQRSAFLRLHPGHVITFIVSQNVRDEASLPESFDNQIEEEFRRVGISLSDLDPSYLLYRSSVKFSDDAVLNSFLMEFLDDNGHWVEREGTPFNPDLGATLQLYLSGAQVPRVYPLDEQTVFRRAASLARQALIARHSAWVPAMLEAMKTSSVFVYVGVAHLYGETGLIERLGAQGVEIRQVSRELACERLLSSRDGA